MLAWLRARLFDHPRTTTAALVTAACTVLALWLGADAVREWQASITAGGSLAAVVLALLRDPGSQS